MRGLISLVKARDHDSTGIDNCLVYVRVKVVRGLDSARRYKLDWQGLFHASSTVASRYAEDFEPSMVAM